MVTGRFRKSEPELQNIPLPFKGAFLKTVERIETSHKTGIEELRAYLTADYSAIELRLLADQKENQNG